MSIESGSPDPLEIFSKSEKIVSGGQRDVLLGSLLSTASLGVLAVEAHRILVNPDFVIQGTSVADILVSVGAMIGAIYGEVKFIQGRQKIFTKSALDDWVENLKKANGYQSGELFEIGPQTKTGLPKTHAYGKFEEIKPGMSVAPHILVPETPDKVDGVVQFFKELQHRLDDQGGEELSNLTANIAGNHIKNYFSKLRITRPYSNGETK